MEKVLKEVTDERVKVYVIWDPIFGGDFNGEAKKLSNRFPDKRVTYFKDPDSLSGTLWETVLKTEREIAWDVYLLYNAGAEWGKEPPQPDYWMHQLGGVTKAPRLNTPKFIAELKALLDKLERKGSKEVKQ
jgi:hypothetical protein